MSAAKEFLQGLASSSLKEDDYYPPHPAQGKGQEWLAHYEVQTFDQLPNSPEFMRMLADTQKGAPQSYFFTDSNLFAVYPDSVIMFDSPGQYGVRSILNYPI